MSDRTQPGTHAVLRVAGGLAAAASGVLLVLGGATPAGAQGAPTPAPSPTATTPGGLSVHLDLPGLLSVHVDLPPLTGLLGGRPATNATPGTATGNPPSATPVPASSAPVAKPTPTSVRTSAPRPVERPRAAPRPQRSTEREAGAGSAPGFDSGRVARDTAPTKPKAEKATVRKRIAETKDQVRRALSPAAPVWLLITVVGLCALGTAAVVRLAGRKDRPSV